MIIRKITLAVILVIILPGLGLASAGDASFIFLRIGSGSRPAAMAEAVTASGADITSAFYNPSLLKSFEGNNQAVFMYNSYFSDVSQNYLALAFKGKKSAIGGYLYLGRVADLERRIGPDPQPSGTFDENNFVSALSYSRGYLNYNFGLSLKYAYERIDSESAHAVMFDFGLLIPLTDEISAGAAARNIGSKPKFISTGFDLSREFRLGLAYKPEYFQQKVEVVADGVMYSDIDSKINLGAEYNFPQYFALRAGYGIGYDSRGISFGGGLYYRQFKFDYAFVGYKNDLGNAHRFTLIATF